MKPEQQVTDIPRAGWSGTLATRIVATVGSVLILLSIAVALLTFMSMRAIALDELRAKGAALADTLNFSFEAMLDRPQPASLQRVADNSTSIEDVRKVSIVDLNGAIIVSSDRSEMAAGRTTSGVAPNILDGPAAIPDRRCDCAAYAHPAVTLYTTQRRLIFRMHRAVVQIVSCWDCVRCHSC